MPDSSPKSTTALIALGVITALAYVAAAFIGFRLAFVAEQITTVWAPTGIALAVLLRFGVRLWPAVWAGAFIANAFSTAPLWTALLIATGNTLEAVAATVLLRRKTHFDVGFRRVNDVVAFVGAAAVLGTAISATLGVATLCLAGVQPWSRFAALWLDWWLGDALGAVIMAPAILTMFRGHWTQQGVVRAALFVAVAAAITSVVFGAGVGVIGHPLEYVLFPLVIAAAVIGGPRVTSLAVLAASIVTIYHTVNGAGPFATSEVRESLILLQIFMGVLAVTGLLLAAAIAERRTGEQREKTAASILRHREEMLRLAQTAGGVATFEWDFKNQVAQCSPEFFHIFGLPARNGVMKGAEWATFVHPDDRERMASHLARALEGLEEPTTDYRINAADGVTRWLTYSGKINRSPLGDRMLGTVVDITERKRTELALVEANTELRRRIAEQQTLLDVLPIGIGIATDRECRHVFTNRAFAETLGLAPDANASKTARHGERPTNFRVLRPDGGEVPDDQLPLQIAAREGREVREVELDIVHDDGRVVRLLEYAAPLLDDLGVPRGAVGAFVDVTARKDAEAALRQEVELRATLARVGASLAGELRSDTLVAAVTDAATRLTEAEFGAFFYNVTDERGESLALYSLSGAPKEAFAGFPHPRATEIFGPTFRGESIMRLDDVTKDPRYGRNAPYHGMPDGHLPVRSYLAVPVVGRGGAVFGGLFFGHSQAGMFTERHELLAAGVAGWGAIALENANLYREAEQANRLKDEFLATLSHELRTPLNAVLGWAHMVREGKMQPAMQQRALESIERNAKAQAQLVEDLLDVSRIMAGKLQIQAEPLDLGAVVVHAVDTVRAAATAKGVELRVHVPDDRRFIVTGDADRFQQVVWNLVSNAIKFTPGGGQVDVGVEPVDSSVEVVVRDTGRGIPASFQPHLFQRFRQMDASKTRQHGGLGLGLSIVRHLTEAQGGTVTAESPGEGQGSTFRVRLPLKAVHTPAADPGAREQLASAPNLAALRVLVVDDDGDARELLRYLLESRGAAATTVASAGEALHLLAQERFDVLIADIAMPGQDGLALVRVLRGLPAGSLNQNIPAIAVTAYAGVGEREQALAAGFTWHLGKPVDAEQLLAAVVAVSQSEI